MRQVDQASERLNRVKERMETAARRSGRDPEKIDLVAVTKSVSFERVVPLLRAGVSSLGENRVQEAQTKYGGRPAPRINPRTQLHLIGPLQTNKAKKTVQLFDIGQSLDPPDVGHALNRHAPGPH